MPVIIDDLERQIVPRWRSFVSAIEFGELAPLKLRPPEAFHEQMLSNVLEDWRREPGLSVAADVVSAAFSIGQIAPARYAAEYILGNGEAPPAARNIALRCLSHNDEGPNLSFVRQYTQVEFDQTRDAIRSHRKRLRDFPINPILWTNLALLYVTLGEDAKAQHAMRVALKLAPDNRFVVRAGCRLFLHLGDPERAHAVLLQTPHCQSDPWLVAGELAIAAVLNRAPKLAKKACRIVDSHNFSPFHVSELAGGLATLEALSGNIKKAKRYYALSLEEPAENAIAQAAWLNRRIGGFPSYLISSGDVRSSEAQAWEARIRGEWTRALAETNQWQTEQPFSSRPALLGGYIASTAIEDFREAERILRNGYLSNRDDAGLCNNLAFALAKQNKVDDAQKFMQQGLGANPSQQQAICLTATDGLIEFRRGHPNRGRQLYRQAIGMAATQGLDDVGAIAKIYHAVEEIRIGSSDCAAIENEAKEAAKKLSGPFRSVFSEKLRKAREQTQQEPAL